MRAYLILAALSVVACLRALSAASVSQTHDVNAYLRGQDRAQRSPRMLRPATSPEMSLASKAVLHKLESVLSSRLVLRGGGDVILEEIYNVGRGVSVKICTFK